MGLLDRPVYYKLAVELGKVYPGSVFVGYVDEFIASVEYMQRGEPCGRPVHPDLRAVVTWCTDQQPGALPPKYTVQTLIPYLLNFSKLEYLNISHCGINDTGVTQLANNLGALGVKTLVLADNQYVTQAGRDAIKQSLSQVPHEVFVSWAKSDGTGTATFKDKSNKTYDLTLEPDSGGNCKISLMPSGVNAGDDTCPPSVQTQIIECLKGAISGSATGAAACKIGGGQVKAICVTSGAVLGCGGAIIDSITERCIPSYSNDGGSGGWDVNDTQLAGTSVSTDVDSGHWGDLRTHDYH